MCRSVESTKRRTTLQALSEFPAKPDPSEAKSPAKSLAKSAARSPVRQVEVDHDHAGQRIDNFLISTLKTVPRSLVYRILRTGQVRVNKGRIKPGFRLSEGDIVRIPPVTVPEQQQVRVPKSVITEVANCVIADDDNWIAINKPAGLAVHAGTGVSFGIIDAIREVFDDESISLVHRLDKSTSGVMVLARNRLASVHFHESLINGRVCKNYSALVCGVLQQSRTVTLKLRKTHPTPNENQVVVDAKDGKDAVSHFRRLAGGSRFSLVDVEIETGRTHQIRVHAASMAHPVLGDERYGDEKLNAFVRRKGASGMFLHARELSFPAIADGAPRQNYTVPADTLWKDVISW